jgi:transposase
LQKTYETCALPTRSGAVASHMISQSFYSRDQTQRSSFVHSRMRPLLSSPISPMTPSQLAPSLGYESVTASTPMPEAERKRWEKWKEATKADQAKERKRLKQATDAAQGREREREEEEGDMHEPKRKVPIGTRIAPVVGKFRSYKIRMYPTIEQQRVLKTWYAASNRCYNSAVTQIRGSHQKQNWTTIRSGIVPSKMLSEADDWFLDIHTKVKGRGVKQAVDAFNTNISNGRKFHLNFRSFKKDPTGVIILEKAFPGDNGPLNSFHSDPGASRRGQKDTAFMKMGANFATGRTINKPVDPSKRYKPVDPCILIRDRHWLIDKLLADGKLMEDGKILWDKRVNAYWLIVLIDTPVKPKIPGVGPTVVSLDPGVRSFNAFYSPDGTYGDLLVGALKTMQDMNKKVDKIKSKVDTLSSNRREAVSNGGVVCSYQKHRRTLSRMRKRMRTTNHRLRCWRNNAHYDAANYLLDNYDWVMIPEFKTSKMVKKGKRKIHGKTARDLSTLAHYKFKEILRGKSELDENKWVRDIMEPGTTGTCGNCGRWNATIKGRKIYECEGCHANLDRDVNGARNNLLALFH